MTTADTAETEVRGETSGRRASRSPAQIISLVIGVWWITNGIGAFILDPNFATHHVHGGGKVLGLVTVTVNGWHALFHLVPGILGIAVANRPRAALRYTLGAGAIYVLVASWGLLARGNSLGVLAVDAPGDAVHMVEGLIALGAGLWTIGPGKADRGVAIGSGSARVQVED